MIHFNLKLNLFLFVTFTLRQIIRHLDRTFFVNQENVDAFCHSHCLESFQMYPRLIHKQCFSLEVAVPKVILFFYVSNCF